MKFYSVKPTQNCDLCWDRKGEGGGCPFGEGIASCPLRLVSSSSRSGTGTTERGLPEPMLELEELKLVVEVFEVSGFLESLVPVDSFVFSDSFALSSPLIYKIRTKIKLVKNTLYTNLKLASRLPWRPIRCHLLCATGGRGGLALPTVFAPLRVYRPKESDHGPSESTRDSRVLRYTNLKPKLN